MYHKYSDEEGKFLVQLARETIEKYVRERKKLDVPNTVSDKLRRHSGVFVTINKLQDSKVALRGCIGRPYPSDPLVRATIDSAVDASSRDPRFNPVSEKELDSIVVELSVLTPPKKIDYSNPDDLPEKIEIGRDGLIVSKGMQKGLLLPQVPVEYGWTTKEFIIHTCQKARLRLDAWKDPNVEFHAFQAEIFGEKSPNGPIIRNPEHPRC
ncbi:MAG: TIGR00296 family protein [Candidatus Lokiarchaeota archaeon]|nr:TIGR00296 family protein [Candidatus Lokiarchaeota archaeon]